MGPNALKYLRPILSNRIAANLSWCDCWDVFACQTLQDRRLSRIVETQQQDPHLLRFMRLQFSKEFDWKAIHHLYDVFRPEDVEQSHHWVKREAEMCAKRILWNFRQKPSDIKDVLWNLQSEERATVLPAGHDTVWLYQSWWRQVPTIDSLLSTMSSLAKDKSFRKTHHHHH